MEVCGIFGVYEYFYSSSLKLGNQLYNVFNVWRSFRDVGGKNPSDVTAMPSGLCWFGLEIHFFNNS